MPRKTNIENSFLVSVKLLSIMTLLFSLTITTFILNTNRSTQSLISSDIYDKALLSSLNQPQRQSSQSVAYNRSSVIQESPLPKTNQEVNDKDLIDTSELENSTTKPSSSFTKNDKPVTVSDIKLLEEEDQHDHSHIETLYTPKKLIPPTPSSSPTNNSLPSTQDIKPELEFLSTNVSQFAIEVPVTQTLYIQFGQEISDNVLNKMRFYPEAEFGLQRLSPSEVNIYPKRLKRLTNYTFGLQSQAKCTFGVELNSCGKAVSWQYALNFTTSYKEAYRYGTSVQGRPLWAYIFGQTFNEFGKRIMLNGGLHGSEWRSGDLSQLATFLDQNPQEIVGRNKVITIVPFTNPDGTNANIRFNARGVNLNRNWPADWDFGPVAVRGAFPLSEPETASLYQLTMEENPGWIISYHAQWPPNGQIFLGDNDNPNTVGFAFWVADRTGYPVGIYPSPDQGSSGDVAGDQCVWANSININCLIIEATYIRNSDWNKNFPMYLSLLRDF